MRGEPAADEGRVSAAAAAYHDRSRTPAETVAVVRPYFAELGITRVARQTGLDRIGIPCFAAFRPNSRSIACNQGKGVDDDAAMASAVMEALEYAVAERPEVEIVRASADELSRRGLLPFDPSPALPLGVPFDRMRELSWVAGTRLRDMAAIGVPLALVALDGRTQDLPGVSQNTNGLASGNTLAEAMFHGTCELIERDAATLWSLLDLDHKRATCIRPESLGDRLLLSFLARMERAGIAVRLFDQTTDLDVPTILAVSAPADGVVVRHFDVAAGSGTHPHPARAALRAITEAAQTRITSIAGARDDIRPDAYRLDGSDEALALIDAHQRLDITPPPAPVSSRADDLLAALLVRLEAHAIDDVVAVPLGGARFGVSVVHMVSATLEDRGPNGNWRPGRRALAALLDQ